MTIVYIILIITNCKMQKGRFCGLIDRSKSAIREAWMKL